MDEIHPGVKTLDHTADVGFEVHGATLAELFHRSAMGMMALIRGADLGEAPDQVDAPDAEPRAPYATGEWRRIAVEAEDTAGLLVGWLRELLLLHEMRRFDYQGARFQTLDDNQLIARVGGGPDARPPVREIKGVTYHGLRVEPEDGGWRARVIFDV